MIGIAQWKFQVWDYNPYSEEEDKIVCIEEGFIFAKNVRHAKYLTTRIATNSNPFKKGRWLILENAVYVRFQTKKVSKPKKQNPYDYPHIRLYQEEL